MLALRISNWFHFKFQRDSECWKSYGRLKPEALPRYASYLLFSLKTHNQAFEASNGGEDDGEEDEDKEEETVVLSLFGAFFMLTAITVMVAISSECAPCLHFFRIFLSMPCNAVTFEGGRQDLFNRQRSCFAHVHTNN